MKVKLLVFSVFASTALGFFASGAAIAGNDKDSDDWRHAHRGTACDASARTMLSACRLGVQDDFTTTLANCVLEPTRSARAECTRTARSTLNEARHFCREQKGARRDVCELLEEDRYQDPIEDPNVTWVNPDEVGATYAPNPYVSVVSGQTLLLRAGEDFSESVVIHVTEDIREIQGVPCRVVWDLVLESSVNDAGETEYDPVEVTQDWFAQSHAGDIYYCGEAVQDLEDGIVFTVAGSFEAGTGFARGGWLVRANPVPGNTHRQEMDIDNAEDLVQYLELGAIPPDEEGGDNAAFPCAAGGCLKTLDFSTLSPGSTEHKYYRAGTGFVASVGFDDGELSGDRDELVCIGDSLDVLDTDACGLADPEGFREKICELVPDALCD